MKNNVNLDWWLSEQDTPMFAGQGDPAGGQAPQTNPQMNMGEDPNMPQADPNVANQADQPPGGEPEDVTADPESPDMPEEKSKGEDFEVWKRNYFKESIKGDSNVLIDLLNEVRDSDGLEPYQKKFIEDNLNVQFLRQNSNIEKACNEVRKMIKSQLDQSNPATSVVSHLTDVLATVPQLNNIFVK